MLQLSVICVSSVVIMICHMCVTCLSYICHLCVTCLSITCHPCETYLSTICHMCVTYQLSVTSVSPMCHLSLTLTLSPARILKDCITCSAVSVSVVSRVMKSRKESKVTAPVLFGSTMDMMRWKSASPWWTDRTTQ